MNTATRLLEDHALAADLRYRIEGTKAAALQELQERAALRQSVSQIEQNEAGQASVLDNGDAILVPVEQEAVEALRAGTPSVSRYPDTQNIDMQELEDFAEYVLRNNGKGDVKRIKLRPVTSDEAELFSRVTGGNVDFSGKEYALNSGDVWHEIKRHSDDNAETSRDQIPISKETILLVPYVLNNPDYVGASGPVTHGGRTAEGVILAKRVNGHVVATIIQGGAKWNKNPLVGLRVFTTGKWDRMLSSGRAIADFINQEGHTQRVDGEMPPPHPTPEAFLGPDPLNNSTIPQAPQNMQEEGGTSSGQSLTKRL